MDVLFRQLFIVRELHRAKEQASNSIKKIAKSLPVNSHDICPLLQDLKEIQLNMAYQHVYTQGKLMQK